MDNDEYVEVEELVGLDDYVVISRPDELIAMERQSSAPKSSSKGSTTSDSMSGKKPSKSRERKCKHERKGSSKGKPSHASPLHDELSPAKKHVHTKEKKKNIALFLGAAQTSSSGFLSVFPKADSSSTAAFDLNPVKNPPVSSVALPSDTDLPSSSSNAPYMQPHVPVVTSTSDQQCALRNFYKKSFQYNEKQSGQVIDFYLGRDQSPTSTIADPSEPIGDGEYIHVPAVTALQRFRALEKRDAELRSKAVKSGGRKKIIGTCRDMCPEKERYSRIAKNCVHVLEMASTFDKSATSIDASHPYMIKEYSRSSADQQEPLPHELRPISVLEMTTYYLLCNIADLPRDSVSTTEWHDFLWDRMRSIRKDITQQELCDSRTVEIIEKCTRFHIHCAEALSEEDTAIFDPKINNENLTKCLQTLKHMYHDLQSKGIQCKNEAEFRSYDILLSLSEGETLRLVKDIRKDILKTPSMKLAFDAAYAYKSHLYVQFFKIFERADYLSSCILHQYIVEARVRALHIIVRAFSTRHNASQYSTARFAKDLKFENESEAVEFCKCHGLEADENYIIIDRKKFTKSTSGLPASRSFLLVASKKTESLGKIINNGDLPPNPKYTYRPHSAYDYVDKFENNKLDVSKEKSEENLQLSDSEMEEAKMEFLSTIPVYNYTQRSHTIVKVEHPIKWPVPPLPRCTNQTGAQTVFSAPFSDTLEVDDLKNIRSEILSELDKLDTNNKQKEETLPLLEVAENQDCKDAAVAPTHFEVTPKYPLFVETETSALESKKISEGAEAAFAREESKSQNTEVRKTFIQPVVVTSVSAVVTEAPIFSVASSVTSSSSEALTPSMFAEQCHFEMCNDEYFNDRMSSSENDSPNSGVWTLDYLPMPGNEEQEIEPRADTPVESLSEKSENTYGSTPSGHEEKSDYAEIIEKEPEEELQVVDEMCELDKDIASVGEEIQAQAQEEMDSESLAESHFQRRSDRLYEEPTLISPLEAALLNLTYNPTGIANPVSSFVRYNHCYPHKLQEPSKLAEGWEPFNPQEIWCADELKKSYGSMCEPAYFGDKQIYFRESRSKWTFFKLCLVFPAHCDSETKRFIDWICAKFTLEISEDCEHDRCKLFWLRERVVVSVRAIFLRPGESESNYAKYISSVTAMMLFIPDSKKDLDFYIPEFIRLRNASIFDTPFPLLVYFMGAFDEYCVKVFDTLIEETEYYSFSCLQFDWIDNRSTSSYVEKSNRILSAVKYLSNANVSDRTFPKLKVTRFEKYYDDTLRYIYEKLNERVRMKGYEFLREEPLHCINFYNEVMNFRASALYGEYLGRVESSWPPVELHGRLGRIVEEHVQHICMEEMKRLQLPSFNGDPKSISTIRHYVSCLRHDNSPQMSLILSTNSDWVMKLVLMGMHRCFSPAFFEKFSQSHVYYTEEDLFKEDDWEEFWTDALLHHSRMEQKRSIPVNNIFIEEDISVKKKRFENEDFCNRTEPRISSEVPLFFSSASSSAKPSITDHFATETGPSSIKSPRKVLSAHRRLRKESKSLHLPEDYETHSKYLLGGDLFECIQGENFEEPHKESEISPSAEDKDVHADFAQGCSKYDNTYLKESFIEEHRVTKGALYRSSSTSYPQEQGQSRSNLNSIADSLQELHYRLERNRIAEDRQFSYLSCELTNYRSHPPLWNW